MGKRCHRPKREGMTPETAESINSIISHASMVIVGTIACIFFIVSIYKGFQD